MRGGGILMGLFAKILSKISPFQDQRAQALLDQLRDALKEEKGLFRQDFYLDPCRLTKLQAQWRILYQEALKKRRPLALPWGKTGRELKGLAAQFASAYETLAQRAQDHNEAFVTRQAEAAAKLILPVEGKDLDSQQLRCIVKEARNHLVLAGAGTGKTTTIVGYVKYLLKSAMATAGQVLVLSFTNTSASEMSHRLEAELGEPLAASTFHKLGLDIITAVEGLRPKIYSQDIRTFVGQRLRALIDDQAYLMKLCLYLLYHHMPHRTVQDFKTQEEYDQYLRTHRPTTLRGETVKSYGELDIANFLYSRGVNYQYEREYPMDTRSSEYSQYRPDFYLPDWDIYIEFFAINRHGLVPPFFAAKKGKTPSQTYQESILWKRELHRQHNTKLIELYSYEKQEDTLLDSLEEQLIQAGVTLAPLSPKELWNQIKGSRNRKLDDVAALFGSVISLAKSNGQSVGDLREQSRQSVYRPSILAALDLIEPVYEGYQQELQRQGCIDFNDMINLAAHYLETGQYVHPFDYVVVDEYQDMARSRYRLLQAMREQRDYRLFCVGDDWQSIFRFTGSDISFILDFENYWGPSEISRIETTYRFPQSLSFVSGRFIMKNPRQKAKELRSAVKDREFALASISGYNVQHAVAFLAQRLDSLPQGSSVLLLGRYRFDLDILRDHNLFSCQYRVFENRTDIDYEARRDLKISFMTIHSSKGLQADYVFLLNNNDQVAGFPSQISNPPVLELLLENFDRYPFAEERRLFYVAITRAKKKVWLLTLRGKESAFIKEIDGLVGSSMDHDGRCPRCGGHLVRRRGPYGEFYGCSNYRSKKCQYTRPLPVAPRSKGPQSEAIKGKN